ncbi:MAG TPA: 6-carboxytetrahydropterin synthase [Acidobacteriaceae bacterium]|nr:6-carboxytetrahydropterin synthase [Acidobacteriaceae bacterium]
MKAYLSRRYQISAAHRLHSNAFSEEENRAVYGKCNHPHGHGHNYVIEVTVSGQVDPMTGMVCNLADLDSMVQAEVIDRFDHTNLNLAECFSDQVPTTENLCRTIYGLVAKRFSAARLERVRIEETANNSFEYSGKD